MKKHLNHIIFVLMILVSGCTGPKSPVSPTQPPVKPVILTQASPTGTQASNLVMEMVTHLNNGDAKGSLDYFTDDARIYFVGMPPTGTEMYLGKEALRPVWEDSVAGHFKWEVEITSSENNIVTAKTKTWHDFTRQLGVAPNEFTDVFVIKDGRITAYTSTLSEDSLTKFKPALAKMMPPTETETPSLERAVSEITFTISGGTCAYQGPMLLKTGNIKVNWVVKDQDRKRYGLTIFTLDADKDIIDLMAATTRAIPPSWAHLFFEKELEPGASQSYSFMAEKGPLYVVCWSKPPDVPIGEVGPFKIVP